MGACIVDVNRRRRKKKKKMLRVTREYEPSCLNIYASCTGSRVHWPPFPSRPSSLFKFLDVYFFITVRARWRWSREQKRNRLRDMRFFLWNNYITRIYIVQINASSRTISELVLLVAKFNDNNRIVCIVRFEHFQQRRSGAPKITSGICNPIATINFENYTNGEMTLSVSFDVWAYRRYVMALFSSRPYDAQTRNAKHFVHISFYRPGG